MVDEFALYCRQLLTQAYQHSLQHFIVVAEQLVVMLPQMNFVNSLRFHRFSADLK